MMTPTRALPNTGPEVVGEVDDPGDAGRLFTVAEEHRRGNENQGADPIDGGTQDDQQAHAGCKRP